jgi:hypothetical protein
MDRKMSRELSGSGRIDDASATWKVAFGSRACVRAANTSRAVLPQAICASMRSLHHRVQLFPMNVRDVHSRNFAVVERLP